MTPSKPSPGFRTPHEPDGTGGAAPDEPEVPLPARPLSHEYVLPSDFQAAKPVQDGLLALLAELNYHEPAVFAVKLALEEAVTNAIRHGNRSDPSRRIRVGWRADAREVLFTVADEGSGFNPEQVPDPTLSENLELPNGRGLMLMKAFMSQVVYNQAGNQVWLLRRNDCYVPE